MGRRRTGGLPGWGNVMHLVRTSAALVAALSLLVPAGAAVAQPGAAPAAAGARLGPVPPLAVLAAAPAGATTADDGAPELEHVDLLAGGLARTTDRSADAPAGAAEGAGDAMPGAVLERELPTDGAAVVGLAVDPATAALPGAEIRFRTAGAWGAWSPVELEDTTGQEGAAEPTGGAGTLTSDALVAAGADAVQVRLLDLDVAPVSSAELLLVDAGAGPALAATTAGPAAGGSGRPGPAAPAAVGAPVPAAAGAAAPHVIPRAAWGANEVAPSPDCVTPGYGTRLDRFVVHHTAGTNSYSAADSPAILRGIQKYHVEGRGWCDVGYNVLVDKYGQVFEGRRGGIAELVVGVHASGHNTNTVGVSVLGDYTNVAPNGAIVDALIRVIGWKSYLHGIDPASQGLKDGVLMDRVIGHREVAQTACPGQIQNRLDEIALQARAVMLTYQPEFAGVSAAAGPGLVGGATIAATIPVPASWTITVRDASGREVTRLTGAVTRRTELRVPWTGVVTGADAHVGFAGDSATITGLSTNGKSFAADAGGFSLTPPAAYVAHDRRGVVELAGTAPAGGDDRTLRLADVGVPAGTAALVLRVCSPGDARVTVRAGDQPSGRTADTALLPDRCGLLLVGLGTAAELLIERAAGSAAVTVDVAGLLPGAAPGVPFWDVPAELPFVEDIAWISGEGITTGYVDGTFRPSAVVSRQAMAAFLYRAAGSPAFTPPSTATFADVPTGHQFFAEIEWLRDQGVAEGTDVGEGRLEFRPSDAVSRQATAAFLYRLSGDDPVPGAPSFRDVPVGHPFADAVGWLAASGISEGYDDGSFRPTAPVTRQAMAAFLHRADAR